MGGLGSDAAVIEAADIVLMDDKSVQVGGSGAYLAENTADCTAEHCICFGH